ncbi:hypothetical protein M441DRAFT_64518 [Trichoderma asperellum CBS 433.97]|uniref:Uncharacterized protein n=1 Tax=Trichoderma asperellum (strain ATCC 204424 / CBS 433.97 / NBRC 101777) TaxID=1042311 RepID=A0A2T3ZJ52_TRIA4|nr:hypothetical protein M441DRAFT_64518 [Trichoderma asperellum CBS 433.97]PTB44839.1 hypothetical protein M441DRAFT_64518 [Trichoderma asperellum CBS 433.97]
MTYFLQPAGASRGSPLFLCLRIAAAGQLGPLVDPPPTSRIPIPSQLSINTKKPLQAEPECQVVGRLLLVKTGAANEAAGISRWNLPFRKGLWSQG